MSRSRFVVLTTLFVVLCGLSYLNGRASGKSMQLAASSRDMTSALHLADTKNKEVHEAYELAMVTFIAGSTHADNRWINLLEGMTRDTAVPTSTDEILWEAIELPMTELVEVKSPDVVDVLRRFEVDPCGLSDCEFGYEVPVLNALDREVSTWQAKMRNVGFILRRFRDRAPEQDHREVDRIWATLDIGPAETYNTAACAYNMIRGAQRALPLVYHGSSWLTTEVD